MRAELRNFETNLALLLVPANFKAMIGFFDTTAFTGARDLNSTVWRKIASGAKLGVLQAATSEITTGELARQARESIAKEFQELEATRRKLEQLNVELKLPVRPASADTDRLVPDWLSASRITLLPIPEVSQSSVVARDLDVRAPFERSGKGYRDTLLWLAFLGWVSALTPSEDPIYFVTSNTRDFCGPKGGLEPELVDELPAGVTVEVLTTAEALADLFELPPPPSPPAPSEVVTASALRALDGSLLYTSLDVDLFTWLTPVEDPTISEVLASDGDAQEVESYEGGTALWLVNIDAEIGVTAYVYKSDVAVLDERLRVTDADWNDHYAEVLGYVPVKISVEVRLESDGESTEAELQEVTF